MDGNSLLETIWTTFLVDNGRCIKHVLRLGFGQGLRDLGQADLNALMRGERIEKEGGREGTKRRTNSLWVSRAHIYTENQGRGASVF